MEQPSAPDLDPISVATPVAPSAVPPTPTTAAPLTPTVAAPQTPPVAAPQDSVSSVPQPRRGNLIESAYSQVANSSQDPISSFAEPDMPSVTPDVVESSQEASQSSVLPSIGSQLALVPICPKGHSLQQRRLKPVVAGWAYDVTCDICSAVIPESWRCGRYGPFINTTPVFSFGLFVLCLLLVLILIRCDWDACLPCVADRKVAWTSKRRRTAR